MYSVVKSLKKGLNGENKVDIKKDSRSALIGFHVFTVCNYISSLFHEGTHTWWKTIISKSRFKEVITRLWAICSIAQQIIRILVTHLESWKMLTSFDSIISPKSGKEIVSLLIFQFCHDEKPLNLYILRANRVTCLMKRSSITHVNEPPLSGCGWDREGNIWIEEAYLNFLKTLL